MFKALHLKAIIFLLFCLYFLGFPVQSFGQSEPPVTETIISETSPTPTQLDILENRIDKLRDENYQNTINSSRNTIDKADSLIGWVGLISTIGAIAFSLVSIGFTIVAIIIAVGIFSLRKELKEELHELRTHVSTTKKNAEEVRSFADQARKKVNEELPKLIKDMQDNQKTWAEFMLSAKSEKDEQKKEIAEKLQEFQEKNNKLTNKVLQNLNNISALNSQATVASGYFPATFVQPYKGGAVSWNETMGIIVDEIETKCSSCGKIYKTSPANVSNILPNFCPDCRAKY